MLAFLYILLAAVAAALPSAHQASTTRHVVATAAHHANALPIPVTVLPKPGARQKKAPNRPYQPHQILVSNLHVIPIQHHIINQNGHSSIHSLVHELAVIPLRVDEGQYEEQRERYRNPFGGYGAGWAYGGHGAGHGFHYAYG